MPVHDVAARGFGSAADSYEERRPSYPAEVVAALVEHLGITDGTRVCDLAAGTGKLTRLLAGTGADLLAVEPVAGMRDVLPRTAPDARTLGGVAEALPFRSGSLDAVVVAQAFHWFDPPRALAEIHRVLRPGGRLGLLWNAWDRTPAWVRRVMEIVDHAHATTEWQRCQVSRDWAGDAIERSGRFGTVTRAAFTNPQSLTSDELVARIATISHIVSAEPDERARTLDAIRRLLASDPATRDRPWLDFSYVVDVYWCERP